MAKGQSNWVENTKTQVIDGTENFRLKSVKMDGLRGKVFIFLFFNSNYDRSRFWGFVDEMGMIGEETINNISKR